MVAGNFLLFLLPHTLQIVIQYIFKRSKCYNLKWLGSHEEPGGVHTEEGAGGDVAVARGALGVLPAPTVSVLKTDLWLICICLTFLAEHFLLRVQYSPVERPMSLQSAWSWQGPVWSGRSTWQ